MLLGIAVIAYLLGTVALGLWASRRVHGAKDFMVAGRSLPLYMNFACVFATWFGAETVLSVSATFTRDGLTGISGDPFGAGACLMLVAIFFARAFYRMDLLTIGDFYHKRFGKTVEVCTSVVITMSYVGWTSAQMTALGLVLHVLSDATLGPETISLTTAIIIGSVTVLIYTIFGGMWSVALTDMIQTAVIIVGLLLIAFYLSDAAGGVGTVLNAAHSEGHLQLFPGGGRGDWLKFIGAFVTVALGSIPQQDVFQRVTSAKDEKTAIRGTLLGGGFYFLFAFVPMFIAYSAIVIDPTFRELFTSEDERVIQRILPDHILNHTPFWSQALFFGALLSAILSTASGTLLAPSSLFTENVIKPFVKLSDQKLLILLRCVLLCFSLLATWYAVKSTKTMYQMVQNAYSVPLAGALVPLAMGVYWKRATTQGAIFSMVFGIGTWLTVLLVWGDEQPVPPQLYGLAASFAAMIIGSLMPQLIDTMPPIDVSKPLAADNSGESESSGNSTTPPPLPG